MTPEEMEIKIADLEAAVEKKNEIISGFESEIEEKDKAIDDLKHGIEAKDKKIADLEAAVEKIKAGMGEKRKITKDDFVTMTKGGDCIDVHPASVEEHIRLGWVKK